MELFHEIPDALAIVRGPNNVHKQVKIYRRDQKFYVGVMGGFVRVVQSFGSYWITDNPSITVVDLDDGVKAQIK